jgi:hypothetical protein
MANKIALSRFPIIVESWIQEGEGEEEALKILQNCN